MKKTFVLSILAATLLSSTSYAKWPDPAELKQNWNKCVQNDPSWYNRWGYWVASFDHLEAYKICRSYWPDASIRMTGCSIDGKWLKAGYYCVFE